MGLPFWVRRGNSSYSRGQCDHFRKIRELTDRGHTEMDLKCERAGGVVSGHRYSLGQFVFGF